MNLKEIKQNSKISKILDSFQQFKQGSEFDLLCKYYLVTEDSSGIYAATTKIPYIVHIIEGIIYLHDKIGGEEIVKAFILHPIFQMNSDINENYRKFKFSNISQRAIILAMEYKEIANYYLPKDVGIKEPKLSQLGEVNIMLTADKLQNYKDFLDNKDLHIKAKGIEYANKLDLYFNTWFDLFRTVEKKFSIEEFRKIIKDILK